MSERQVQTLAELGAHLRQTRELKGLDLKQLAAELRLLELHLVEIEKGEYDHIKSSVFAKGYIRKYAQRLGLDVDQILVWFDQASGEIKPVEPYRRLQGSKWPAGTGVALIVVLLIVVGAGSWMVYDAFFSETTATAIAAAPAVLVSPPVNEVLSPAEADASAGLSFAAGEADEQDEADSADSADDAAIDASNTEQIDNSAGSSLATTALESSPEAVAQLELRFSGDCWVEVRDSNRKLLVADLKKKGDVVSLQGVAPYEVLVGYAPAVEVSYQGQQIPIVTSAGQVKAQVTVGG